MQALKDFNGGKRSLTAGVDEKMASGGAVDEGGTVFSVTEQTCVFSRNPSL